MILQHLSGVGFYDFLGPCLFWQDLKYTRLVRNRESPQVVLYNANLTNLNNVTGDQIGAYFGYSLASCDVNGDGLDDLLIGENLQIAIMMLN